MGVFDSSEIFTTIASYDDCAAQWSAQHDTPGYWDEGMHCFNKLLPSGRVLELGFGGGRDAEELRSFGYQYVGIDASVGMQAVASARLPDLEFKVLDMRCLTGLKAGVFDGVWASASLLHLPKSQVRPVLLDLRGLLRDGAICFISLKDGTGERSEMEEVSGVKLTRFFSYWSVDEFSHAAERAGYRTVEYLYQRRSERTAWHCFLMSKESR